MSPPLSQVAHCPSDLLLNQAEAHEVIGLRARPQRETEAWKAGDRSQERKKQRLRDGDSEMPAVDAAGRASEGSPSLSAGSQPFLLGCLKEGSGEQKLQEAEASEDRLRTSMEWADGWELGRRMGESWEGRKLWAETGA